MKTKTGQLRLRADAVPTLFVHRCEPKRRKDPAVRNSTELQLHFHPLLSDHTYCSKVNIGTNCVQY